MKSYSSREVTKNTTVNTTVTMPQWLKDLAKKNNVNFSKSLQGSLKDYLNVK